MGKYLLAQPIQVRFQRRGREYRACLELMFGARLFRLTFFQQALRGVPKIRVYPNIALFCNPSQSTL
jgi:hypothetical protein